MRPYLDTEPFLSRVQKIPNFGLAAIYAFSSSSMIARARFKGFVTWDLVHSLYCSVRMVEKLDRGNVRHSVVSRHDYAVLFGAQD